MSAEVCYVTLQIFCLQNGLSPLHLCAQEDKVNVAAILVKNGAEVDSTTKVPPIHSFFRQPNFIRHSL